MSNAIKIMVVDDHDMVRLGLKTYLAMESDFLVTGEAANGKEALELLKGVAEDGLPDMILMDLMMPLMDGVDTTREVSRLYPQVKVILLTSFLEDEKVLQAIEAGAITYVLKTVSSDELAHVIRSSYRGLQVMNSEVSQALTRGLRQRSTQSGQDDGAGLTSREMEVMLLIADGKSNKDIADELHISIKTVKTHVSNLLMKCEVEDRTQLAIYAHRKGWSGKPVS
ncbi:response regulator transcription factor [Paenibacillus hemerocallicola]|jgi:NarL family two-component system response regulator LiaR|uniref:Response regulator transcription factor n=1 Tax=Paenibacillus hemerocallicola TaxID=1172614 RepID=A0A5C4SXM9_9BACL|nr:response regulator transcription factor [Paenibacillus hemerocallicola]TNJ55601.1 response regulator transcription factor [Paenibacillus hemerocallicola]